MICCWPFPLAVFFEKNYHLSQGNLEVAKAHGAEVLLGGYAKKKIESFKKNLLHDSMSFWSRKSSPVFWKNYHIVVGQLPGVCGFFLQVGGFKYPSWIKSWFQISYIIFTPIPEVS